MERGKGRKEYGEDRFNGEVVEVMRQVGYRYDKIPTDLDDRGNLHFSRCIGETIYPHFHITVNLNDNHFDLHVDSAKHSVSPNWRGLASEMMRLKGSLNGQYPDQMSKQRIRDRLTRLLPEPTLRREQDESLYRDRPKVRNNRKVRRFHPNASNSR